MTMESVVPPEITAELTQILSNLVLGDNDIRANAERAVNERLATTPEMYILALAQFAIQADTEVVSFILILSFSCRFSNAMRAIAVTDTDIAMAARCARSPSFSCAAYSSARHLRLRLRTRLHQRTAARSPQALGSATQRAYC